MKTTPVCLLFCLAVNLIFAADATKDDVSVEKKSDGDNFFAARGRRSGDTPDDFFWANRGKRSPGSNHLRVLRDQGNFNVPRPNGFFFPSAGKRASTYNIPRPNGFFFPSATGKRSFNLPRPNGFIFPSLKSQGKRSAPSMGDDTEMVKRSQFWNLARPNGFFFPSVPVEAKQPKTQSKRLSEEYVDDENDSYDDAEIYSLLSSIFRFPEVEEGDDITASKRDNFDESTFFAGRGKRDSDVDLGAFFAGRGKKDVDADLAAFFAGRGKKRRRCRRYIFCW
jgi:hypothetical protein